MQIIEVDPHAAEVMVLRRRHHAFALEVTPPDHVHAFDPALPLADTTFVGAHLDGVLLGIGALRVIGPDHAEVKSMHTLPEARGRGVGRAVLADLLERARGAGMRRVSLETGTYDAFAPARALYASMGFVPCPPFADYSDNPFSTCMTLHLG